MQGSTPHKSDCFDLDRSVSSWHQPLTFVGRNAHGKFWPAPVLPSNLVKPEHPTGFSISAKFQWMATISTTDEPHLEWTCDIRASRPLMGDQRRATDTQQRLVFLRSRVFRVKRSMAPL